MDIEHKVLETLVLETIKEQRRSRRWRIFFRFIWLSLVITVVFVYGGDKPASVKGKQVAVIDLHGVISYENKTYQNFIDGLQVALKNKDTVAVIIRANSPGGSPVYSDMLYNEIMRLRKQYSNKPIDVVVEEVCASGCYYIASAANNIYANPASLIGSIGVIYTGFGLNGLMDKLGVDSRLIVSGKNKAMGYPFLPLNKEQQKMQQDMMDKIHNQFIQAVKTGRGKKLSSDPDLFSGRVWIGTDGVELGLIDGFASVDSLALDKYKSENLVNYTHEDDKLNQIFKKLGVYMVDFAKQEVASPSMGIIN